MQDQSFDRIAAFRLQCGTFLQTRDLPHLPSDSLFAWKDCDSSMKTSKSHLRLRALCEGAVLVALAQVLSYLKLFELPQGGSITIGMFPIFY